MPAPPGNKYALGNSGGRPAYYETPEELAAACQDFFDWCILNSTKSTVTGLCLYIGFCSRSSLDVYEDKGEEFRYIIKRAKLAVENSYELSGQTIDIFALKNMGWKDKTESEISGPNGQPFNITLNL
jgi:hypothetical protein